MESITIQRQQHNYLQYNSTVSITSLELQPPNKAHRL